MTKEPNDLIFFLDKLYFNVTKNLITYTRYEYPGEHYHYDIQRYGETPYNNKEPDEATFFKIMTEAAMEDGRREMRTKLLSTLGIDQFGKFKDFK